MPVYPRSPRFCNRRIAENADMQPPSMSSTLNAIVIQTAFSAQFLIAPREANRLHYKAGHIRDDNMTQWCVRHAQPQWSAHI
eukprot:842446-Pyramimonas_sp.AAC.1